MNENRIMKPIEIVLRRGGDLWRRENYGRVNLRYIISIYVNITMYPPPPPPPTTIIL
jgi:hypothetical protein